jgi:hypothetical protein
MDELQRSEPPDARNRKADTQELERNSHGFSARCKLSVWSEKRVSKGLEVLAISLSP